MSLSLSRGARAAAKHARLGPALASKMASASSSTVVQGWPNTKDDYELKEVIGEYRSPGRIIRHLDEYAGRSGSRGPARVGRSTGDAHRPTDRRLRLREIAAARANGGSSFPDVARRRAVMMTMTVTDDSENGDIGDAEFLGRVVHARCARVETARCSDGRRETVSRPSRCLGDETTAGA